MRSFVPTNHTHIGIDEVRELCRREELPLFEAREKLERQRTLEELEDMRLGRGDYAPFQYADDQARYENKLNRLIEIIANGIEKMQEGN